MQEKQSPPLAQSGLHEALKDYEWPPGKLEAVRKSYYLAKQASETRQEERPSAQTQSEAMEALNRNQMQLRMLEQTTKSRMTAERNHAMQEEQRSAQAQPEDKETVKEFQMKLMMLDRLNREILNAEHSPEISRLDQLWNQALGRESIETMPYYHETMKRLEQHRERFFAQQYPE